MAVGAAVRSGLPGPTEIRHVEPSDFAPGELDNDDVLLIGDSGYSAFEALELSDTGDVEQFKPGLVQFLGCRPPIALINELNSVGAVVAGISPWIADRVANRVVGFAGSLGIPVDMGDQAGAGARQWGIVGLGFTGSAVARKLAASGAPAVVFGADVRTPPTGLLTELNVRRQTLDLLVAGSDVVAVHAYPGPTTRPLVSERELGLMKPGAVLINTSEFSVVDEDAVLAALESGALGGYATDCPGFAVAEAAADAHGKLVAAGKLVATTNPLTNQVGAAQQVAKYITTNVRAFLDGGSIEGKIELVDFPMAGDPSFWSSRMIPRQD
ncbi:MAG: NAD(P)-dependent oxidoreductase [Dehalococcoidia bacterium]|nr:NAD(P)-dependent oxidoreductase [Dehalococcoidia bacterium]